jgi:type IV secretion system protein VirD4
MPAPGSPTDGIASPQDRAFGWIVAVLGAVVSLVWAGAALAAALTGSAGQVTFTGAGRAILQLPTNVGHPARAWPDPAGAALPGPVTYWLCQLAAVVGAAAAVTAGRRLWRRVGSDGPRPLGIDPEAGFAARRDLSRLAVTEPTPGRVSIGRSQGRLVATELDASLAVVGPSGCGKTAGFAIPAILEWEGPILATSVKADLLDATIGHRRNSGDVWVYDPTGCSGHATSTWSPLEVCRTWAGALRVAAWMAEAAQPRNDTVSDGDYWYSQARKGLAPYLHAAAVARKPLATLVRWIDGQEETEVEQALLTAARVDPDTGEIYAVAPDTRRWDELFDASIGLARAILAKQGGDAAVIAEAPLEDWPEWLVERVTDAVHTEWALEHAPAGRDLLAPLMSAKALWRKEPRLRGSVFATIENVLDGWADPDVTAAAIGCDIDLDRWLTGNNTLYVVATAHEQARLRPVLTTLVQQAIRRAYDTAARNRGRLPHPCLVLLDEAGNTAPLRDLPGYASTARSHAITLVTVWQDLAQIKATYADRAQTVLNNHRAKLFGAGIADADTLEYVSKLIGDEGRTERNLSADLSGTGRRSISEHRTYRRTAAVDVVRRIPPGEGVLLYGSELPAHIHLRPWFAEPLLRSLAPADLLRAPVTTRRYRDALLPR